MLPEDAGSGETPPRAANAASERTRPACDQACSTVAATTGPTPGSSSRCGAWAVTARVSAVLLAARSVSRARMRRARRMASPRPMSRAVAGVEAAGVRQAAIVVIVAAARRPRASMLRSRVRSSAVSALTARVRSPVI